MLMICNLSELESCRKHCLYLFICMAVRQCYGRRRRDLELGAVQMDNLRSLFGIRRMDRVRMTDKEVMRSDEGNKRKD